jgi:3-phosphoshikimate 1-carboxyvinyltransferase
MGATIDAPDGHPPLTIHGVALHAITHTPNVPSAQVKSAVILAGLHATGTTTVVEPARTRDHTERALRAFGGQVEVDHTGTRVAVAGSGADRANPCGARRLLIGVLMVAAACPGSRVEIEDVGLNPTRTDLIGVPPIRRPGEFHHPAPPANPARIIVEGTAFAAWRSRWSTRATMRAIAALASHGGEVGAGARDPRVKESDRIAVRRRVSRAGYSSRRAGRLRRRRGRKATTGAGQQTRTATTG